MRQITMDLILLIGALVIIAVCLSLIFQGRDDADEFRKGYIFGSRMLEKGGPNEFLVEDILECHSLKTSAQAAHKLGIQHALFVWRAKQNELRKTRE